MALDKQKVILASMTIALIVAVVYIVADWYQGVKVEEQNTVFQQGAEFGYQQAVAQLLQQASTCQQVPVTMNNVTLNLVAVECLQQAE